MRHLLLRLDTGEMSLAEVPLPAAPGANLVMETRATVVSASTERTLVKFGRSNLLAKVRSRPDKVEQALDKMRAEGTGPALTWCVPSSMRRFRSATAIPVSWWMLGHDRGESRWATAA